MTSPGSDAHYSPVPQPVNRPAEPAYDPSPWVSPVGQPQGQPAPPVATPGPTWSAASPMVARTPGVTRAHRPVWILAVVALALVVLGGSLAVGALLGRRTRVLADGQERVSLTVPRSWSDDTEPDPGQARAPDEQQDNGRIPDVEAESFFGSQYLAVYLDPLDADGLAGAHQLSVDQVCERWSCATRAAALAVTIGGQPGLQQVVSHDPDDEGGGVSVILTVQSSGLVVSAVAERESLADEPPSPRPLIHILHTLSFTR